MGDAVSKTPFHIFGSEKKTCSSEEPPTGPRHEHGDRGTSLDGWQISARVRVRGYGGLCGSKKIFADGMGLTKGEEKEEERGKKRTGDTRDDQQEGSPV